MEPQALAQCIVGVGGSKSGTGTWSRQEGSFQSLETAQYGAHEHSDFSSIYYKMFRF